ncbi:DMT family transporter [Kineosporia sp. NBRC 101731]|uniref:DMT family transporter n=1 Tax=Kineosporia sp. NBRC 101731 TaxID=3032199 RepID=UPI0024A5B909|nr:DMT family transporter [Kineosporia sp. NBRC 101731]GLY29659.1 membrane protein [Kineosporia sp. NBRC 101731]
MTALAPPPAPSRTSLLPLGAAGVTVVLWASAFVGIRAAGHDYSAGPLALGRLLAGSVALTAVGLFQAAKARRATGASTRPLLPRRPLLFAAMLWGVAWFGLYNVSLNRAEQSLDAGTTALLVNLAPVLIAVLAGLLLGEGFPVRLMIGMAVAFSGVALIAITTSDGRGDLVGVLLGLASAVLYATAATAQKRLLTRIDALALTWIGCLSGTVACLPFAPGLIRQAADASLSSTLSLLYLGVFPTAIAFLAWGYALSRTNVGRLAASTYVVPPLVVLMSWALLGEVPGVLALVGGVLCLAGVGIATVRRAR